MTRLAGIAAASANEVASMIRTEISPSSTNHTDSTFPTPPNLISDLVKEFMTVFTRQLETVQTAAQKSNSEVVVKASNPSTQVNGQVNGHGQDNPFGKGSLHSHKHEKSYMNSDQSQTRAGKNGTEEQVSRPAPSLTQVKKPFYRR